MRPRRDLEVDDFAEERRTPFAHVAWYDNVRGVPLSLSHSLMVRMRVQHH